VDQEYLNVVSYLQWWLRLRWWLELQLLGLLLLLCLSHHIGCWSLHPAKLHCRKYFDCTVQLTCDADQRWGCKSLAKVSVVYNIYRVSVQMVRGDASFQRNQFGSRGMPSLVETNEYVWRRNLSARSRPAPTPSCRYVAWKCDTNTIFRREPALLLGG